MSGCDGACTTPPAGMPPGYRGALQAALLLNVLMFGVEIAGSLYSGSVSLLADALDFAGDAANYALSLAVLSHGPLWRARAAWIKGASMGAYGVFVLAKTAWAVAWGVTPEPFSMGLVALLALVVNFSVAAMLFAFRTGDADMRSVWLCSRNDAIGNAAVMLAAVGVAASASAWPDWLVAGLMALLALNAARSVMHQARGELVALQPRTTASP